MPPGSDPTAPAASVDSRPIVVRGQNVGVRYVTTAEKYPTLKRTLVRAVQRTRAHREVIALHDVSFSVPLGSVYGVIGTNGSGKSTLFRTVSGILTPTSGRVSVAGRVTPLLTLGVGFNRELSGRENVLLGGLAAGLDPEQVAAGYHDVVRFAELGAAIDSPMRTYSSGMIARLGFAVAANLDPDILLLDEALSAGDATFKAKCMDKIQELAESECTFMLVSHGLQIVRQLADRCLWIDKGHAVVEGPAGDVIDAYLARSGVAPTRPAAMVDF